MGEDALKAPEKDENDGEIEVVKDDEPKDGEQPEGEESEQSEQKPEFEVVREGVDGSQPAARKQPGFKKRIDKLNAKITASTEEASQASVALALEQEKTKLLEMALAQKNEADNLKPPDPDDFDDGAIDPKYVSRLHEYNQGLIASEVKKQTASISVQQSEPATDTALLSKQTKHYEAAADLGAKDYAEVEDAAIDILGKEIVNQLIKASDSSHLILYYLGKNPDEAEEIAELVKTDPVKATLQLGRLEAELKVKPKANDEPTPDPDEELVGGSPSATNSKQRRYEQELDAARSKTQEARNMSLVLAVKRKWKDSGVTL